VLSKDEYDKILNLETNKPSIEFAKLFMIVNCRIGLRSIDLIEVIKEFELNSNTIRFFQNKTGFLQTIEIPEDVIKMIRRLKELFGDGLSRDYINDNLKEIGKLIGMNEIETSVKFYGSKRVIVKKPRWDLLTTHVGRRTFATKAMEKNVPIHIAMQFTGHKTLASFQRYINPASFKNKYILSQLWE
jgi:integrase